MHDTGDMLLRENKGGKSLNIFSSVFIIIIIIKNKAFL